VFNQTNCKNCSEDKLRKLPSIWDDIVIEIGTAVSDTAKETDLFRFGVNERAVSHRFGCHLQSAFRETGWSVDCEYNRAGHFPKGIPRTKLRTELESYLRYPPACFSPKEDITFHVKKSVADIESTSEHERPRRVIPDIVVHRRGCNCCNVIVIEMKVNDTTVPCILLDWAKLSVFTDPTGTDYPIYKFGLFIDMTDSASAKQWLFTAKDRRGALLEITS